MTAEELRIFLADVWNIIKDKICGEGERPSKDKPFPHGFWAQWSLDNASVNTAAYKCDSLEWPGKPPGQWDQVAPPEYSPDLHKVCNRMCAVFSSESCTYTRIR